MSETIITIPTDAATAARYNAASDAERKKIQLLVQALLQNSPPSNKSLQQLMNEMSEEAQKNGLTPELLNDLLDENE